MTLQRLKELRQQVDHAIAMFEDGMLTRDRKYQMEEGNMAIIGDFAIEDIRQIFEVPGSTLDWKPTLGSTNGTIQT